MISRLLVLDDESGIRQVVSTALRALNFEVVESARGEEAIRLITLSRFDAVLLDINMPGLGGIATCRAIRRHSPTLPIVMLTVRDAEDDKVEALDAGADDYVTKPFAIRELVARLKAVARRAHPATPVHENIIRIAELEIDGDRRTFTKRGTPIHLTPTEFNIVFYLMRHKGRVITHRKLLASVWGSEFRYEVEYLRTYMRQLRKKIEDDASRPRYLMTEPYIGYRFNEGIGSMASLVDTVIEVDVDGGSDGFEPPFLEGSALLISDQDASLF